MNGQMGGGARYMAVGTSPSPLRKFNPSRFRHYEYFFYLALFYSIVNATWGINIPYLASSVIMTIALLCLLARRTGLFGLLKKIGLPLLCIVSYVFIQRIFHGENGTSFIPYFMWGAYLVIVQSLLSRPNFFFRMSFALFATGMAMIPYLRLSGGEDRGGLGTASAISNPNDLAAWFGFCVIVFTIRALQTTRILDRFGSGLIAFVSLMIVGATVSRGALSALTLAAVVGFRRQLKRGFVPIFILVLMAVTGLAFGVFDNAISHYSQRGIEETGRMTVFKPAFQRFIDSPLVGVGLSSAGTLTPEGEVRLPHDSLLYLALVSGLFPLLFFLAYMLVAYNRALHASLNHPYLNYLMPLIAYCSFILIVADNVFIAPWFILTFAACLYETRRVAQAGAQWRNNPGSPWVQASSFPRMR